MEGQRKKIMGRPPGRWGGNNPWAGSAKVFSFNVQLILFHSFMKGFKERKFNMTNKKGTVGKQGMVFTLWVQLIMALQGAIVPQNHC